MFAEHVLHVFRYTVFTLLIAWIIMRLIKLKSFNCFEKFTTKNHQKEYSIEILRSKTWLSQQKPSDPYLIHSVFLHSKLPTITIGSFRTIPLVKERIFSAQLFIMHVQIYNIIHVIQRYWVHIWDFSKGANCHNVCHTCTLGTNTTGTGTYPSFLSMKRLVVLLLPTRWDASASQGYPQHLNRLPWKFAGAHLYS